MNQSMARAKLIQLLGKLPPQQAAIQAEVQDIAERKHDWCEKLVLDLNGIEAVPAYFLKTKHCQGQAPVILYHHAHGLQYDIGKQELIDGRPALQSPAYGETLTELGISVLCFDTWAFGERSQRTESDLFKQMLWNGQVMWGMMLYDSMRAIDYIVSRDDVDDTRIGTMGISMGSNMAWWLAALDTRIAMVAEMCCMTDYQSLLEEDGLSRHGLYYYVPDLINHFTTAQINALIAPRPHLCAAGIHDSLTPLVGLHKIDEELSRVYANCAHPSHWRMNLYDCGHEETLEMRQDMLAFIQQHL